MAIPLQTQLFDAFLGEQEGIHSIILPDVFSSGGSKNIFIDKYGRAKKISGYSAQNSSAVTTNTGASATLVRALFPYKATSGGTVTRQLLGIFDDATNEVELWYSADDGATWTFAFDWGSTVVGQVPDFAQFGDTCYITTGKIAPKKWASSTLSTTGRTQSPTITSTLSASAGALSGLYKYKLLSMVGGARQAGSAASTVLSVQDKQVTLSWTADANTNVTGYEIYRTSGTGDVYYFLDYVDLRATVAYTDNIADLTILENRIMEEHGDPPPTVYFCEPHKQRMWWGRTDTTPTRAYWSDPGLPEDVLSDNFLDFSDSDTQGDVITGMVGNQDGKLVVFTEKGVWTVSGTGSVIGNIVDWTRVRSNAQVGCISHRTAIRVPAGAKFSDQNGKIQVLNVTGYGGTSGLAYMTPLGDIRFWDGEHDVIISHPKKTTLSTINYAQRAKSFAVADHSRDEITWVFATASSGEPDTAITWNYRWGVWYTREWAFSHACESDNATTASVMLAGSRSTTTGGYVYKLWSGNSFAGSAINAIWMTKSLFGVEKEGQGQPVMTQRKRFRFIDFLFETEQTNTLMIEWLAGGSPDNGAAIGSVTIAPGSATVIDADGDTVTTTDGDSLIVAQLSTTAIAQLKDSTGSYAHDESLRIRISDNSSNGSWSLEAMNLAYQVLPGVSRRMQ